MIEVRVVLNPGDHEEALGIIQIENTDVGDDGTSAYSVRFAVDRCGAVGLHQRELSGFPRTQYNVLALLKQALETLDPSELELEHGTGASDLARRQRRPLQALQAWASQLRHH